MSLHRLLYITFFCSLFFLFVSGTSTAQQLRYNFRNYTSSDGLPSSEVYQVLQDTRHYLWFATDHGICRYNGYEFKTYNLADNSILGMYEDHKKRLWAYSFSGRLFYYEDGYFKDYKWNDKLVAEIKPKIINGIYVDNADVVHISTSKLGYYIIFSNGEIKDYTQVKSQVKCLSFQVNSSDFFTAITDFPASLQQEIKHPNLTSEIEIRGFNNNIHKITIPHIIQPERNRVVRLEDGTVFFFSRDCIVKLKREGGFEFRQTNFSIDDVELVDGSYYIATGNGLLIENEKGELLHEYFKGIHITSVEKDYEGGVWVSTLTKGVYYINALKILHVAKDDELFICNAKSLFHLEDSSILVNVNKTEIVNFKPNKFLVSKILNVTEVASFYTHDKNSVIVGCSYNYHDNRVDNKKHKIRDYSLIIMPNNSNIIKRGNIYYSGSVSSVIELKLTNNTYVAQNAPRAFYRVSKIFLTANKEILVGNQFGLWHYREGLLFPFDSTKRFLQSRITDINEYKNENLCLGTKGAGFIIHIKDSFHLIKEENGLNSNNIRRIFIDKNHIWLATNRGISIVTIESEKPFAYSIKNISVQDGLLSNEVNDIINYGNEVVVATNSGISFLNKQKLLTKAVNKLQFYLVSVSINGKEGKEEELGNLTYKMRTVSVSFDALNYSSPGRNNFRYRLEGYDTNWVYTNNRSIQFNPAPYGKYKLQIQAKREFDSWSDAATAFSASINCAAPFWSSAWFYTLLTIGITGIAFIYFKQRITALQKRQEEREDFQHKIAEAEQMALKSQMNPHFVFNCLNSIQQYVIERDVAGANKFVSEFSKLIRQTLDFSAKEKISLEEEISYLTTYLNLEKLRMEDGFQYEVHVNCSQPLSVLLIPPLLLQPYVENALRHGVRYLKNKRGVITLIFREEQNSIVCIVEDNGIGRKQAMKIKSVNRIEYQSKGMTLTAERIKLLNKVEKEPVQIKVEDIISEQNEIAGTRITLIFPLP